jgi:hypothetical protein
LKTSLPHLEETTTEIPEESVIKISVDERKNEVNRRNSKTLLILRRKNQLEIPEGKVLTIPEMESL